MIKIVSFTHEKGLHCRPSVRLAQLAKMFDASIQVVKDGQKVNATDVLQVLSLGIMPGDITLEATGNDAERALTAIEELFKKIDEEP